MFSSLATRVTLTAVWNLNWQTLACSFSTQCANVKTIIRSWINHQKQVSCNHKKHLFKDFLTMKVQERCSNMITKFLIALSWHFQLWNHLLSSTGNTCVLVWVLVDLWHFNDCHILLLCKVQVTVRNIHSWPTISLRLLQPTLSACNSLQTADK